eukprot:Gb_09259 [translate_table: standard]
MDYPFLRRSWDRYSPRRSYQYPYHAYPPYYSASAVTPTKSDYDEWATPKLKPKPRRFTVPLYDSPLAEPEYRIPNTSLGHPHNSAPLRRREYQGDMPIPIPVNFVSKSTNDPRDECTFSGRSAQKRVHPQMDENVAAVKIQALFRGFSVRKSAPLKNLTVITQVRANMKEISQRIGDSQVVQLLRQNEKERLRITEEIMSLLLKLDAIQGVHCIVRESRKAVTRELVNLQEIVDAIIAGKSMEGEANEGPVGSETVEDGLSKFDSEQHNFLSAFCNAQEEKSTHSDNTKNEHLQNEGFESSGHMCIGTEQNGFSSNNTGNVENSMENCHEFVRALRDAMEEEPADGSLHQSGGREEVSSLSNAELSEHDYGRNTDCMESEESSEIKQRTEDRFKTEAETHAVEKVRKENERLRKLIADLCKRNLMQSEMIHTLNQRLGQLEDHVSRSRRKKSKDRKMKLRNGFNNSLSRVLSPTSEEEEAAVMSRRTPSTDERRERRRRKSSSGNQNYHFDDEWF